MTLASTAPQNKHHTLSQKSDSYKKNSVFDEYKTNKNCKFMCITYPLFFIGEEIKTGQSSKKGSFKIIECTSSI